MNPVRRIHFILAALAAPALLLFVPTLAFGDAKVEGRAARGGGPQNRIERIVQRLDLEEAQRDQIRATVAEHRPAMREARETLRERTQAVRTLVEEEGASDRQIESAVNAVVQARADLAHRREALIGAIRDQLQPRQQAELILMMQDRRQQRMRRPGMRGGEGRRGEGRRGGRGHGGHGGE